MNKRQRNKYSKIHKNKMRRFSIFYNPKNDRYDELTLYKGIYYNPNFHYCILDNKYYEQIYGMLMMKYGFNHVNKQGESLPLMKALYKNKIPVYTEQVSIDQYSCDEVITNIDDKFILKNDDKNSLFMPILNNYYILARETDGTDRVFPSYNKEKTIRYILSDIQFLYKGYTFILCYQQWIKTNAPNHIIEDLVQKTDVLGYIRSYDNRFL